MSLNQVLTVTGTGVVTTDWLIIRHIHWYYPTASAGFVLKDSSDIEILKDYTTTAGTSELYEDIDMGWNGLNCTQLDGGTLYIYLG